ncbi:MAG TPA: glycosyl hydrolase family 28 protein [Candidatus Methylacidiphilales bacterium]|nr:glycosyl hydrolase family 28 protein [Candidatus Methylacidiphilales bacterium]
MNHKIIYPLFVLLSLTALPLRAADSAVAASTAGTDSTSANSTNPFTPPNFPLPVFRDKTYSVKDFGATGEGKADDTAAVDRAIEKCNGDGGGTVFFPAGKYLVASVHLKSNIQMMLDKNAVISGMAGAFEKPEPNEYAKYQDGGHSHFHDALMWGDQIENFALIGGQVNGGGPIGHGDPKPGNGDKLVAITNGKNLLFKGVTHLKGGHFCYLLNNCQNITVINVVIKESRDAIDLMGCSNVQVHDCNFTGCGDDTLGIKSDYALGKTINSANIYAWNCYFESGCNGLQFGSETAGDFHNVNIWDIRIGKALKAGIGITTNDSAVIDDVHYNNITIKGATTPLYMLTTSRMRTGDKSRKIGTIKDVTITNVTATDCQGGRMGPPQPSTISGWPSVHFQNIVLENVKITYKGGGTSAEANVVPGYPKDYSPKSFGTRPAAGLYARNVDGLVLRNVNFTYENADQRPPLVISDVNGLELDNFTSQKAEGVDMMKLIHVQNLNVHNCPGLPDQKGASVVQK